MTIRKCIYRPRVGKIPVGVIGIGGWGSQYINILQRSDVFDLRACFDVNEDILESVCSFTGCLMAKSFDELLMIEDIRAVIILTPNYLHYEQCIKAIEKGKHVFVEKPISNTVEEAIKIGGFANKSHVIVSVGHNIRRRAEFRILKEIVDHGEIGKIVMVEANISQSFQDHREITWRTNMNTCPSGVLSQLGIHYIDIFHYIFGEIEEVKSFITTESPDYYVPITSVSIFSFKTGILGYLGTNYLSKPIFTMRVYGTEGNLIVEDTNLYLVKNKKRRKIKTKYINTLKNQIEEFGACIMNDTKPEVGINEALENMLVIDAIMKSTKVDGKSIRINRGAERE